MTNTASLDHNLFTIPETSRRSGVPARRIRNAVRAGDLAAYGCGTAWPRIYWPEFVRWVRSTRISASDAAELNDSASANLDHAGERVDE